MRSSRRGLSIQLGLQDLQRESIGGGVQETSFRKKEIHRAARPTLKSTRRGVKTTYQTDSVYPRLAPYPSLGGNYDGKEPRLRRQRGTSSTGKSIEFDALSPNNNRKPRDSGKFGRLCVLKVRALRQPYIDLALLVGLSRRPSMG
jgi:hypothetical protein